ncbi:MAG TPA: NAD+ synthase [Deltaproteobacteria bacterium]|nr:MAG: NAD+ synthase [Deltaproteobacteria bacterium GWA2_65_63]OGP27066.1 MAG: NAD+ synthase [Deltaproteobacteria bacterium GWB2_65_81]OGP40081.1 MAG: NAD+ synthase [Deltaproteobacteria bacterium GWC2_66_88]OGP79211.1 MAG: NAD+ synthase [Deltaproteobacteria bacterium RBG_16_66_15]HAM33223.1 NAD+ synthase [Deltaproteobacteria bacterium]
MSQPLRLALAQVNATVGDIAGNVRTVLAACGRAREAGAHLVVFPEMVLPGYPPEDLLLRASFVEENLAAWREVAGSVRGVTVVAGFVDRDARGRVCNAAGVAEGGRVLGVYRKMHLPNYGVFDEMRYFRRGTEPMVFPVGDRRVGITICEDIWVRRGPVAREAKEGANLILNISASPYHAGKWEVRRDLVAAHARRNGLPVAYCNLVGGQDELVFDGGSMVVGPKGDVIARAAMFSEEMLLCDIGGPSGGGTIAPIPSLEEEIFRALVLGTRDYVEKNRFPGAIIGLSGGIDSSIVAAVAVEALGPSRVLGVTLSSPFTSRESVEDAHALSRNLGIRCIDLSIAEAFGALTGTLAETFAGRAADTTEENLQARVRGTILMALSNKFGSLVLTTGNKSEMSVGYATLYGDMAGGFAVIKDLFKTMVYRVSRWYNKSRGRDVIPERVLTKPPSAELRPGQKDSDSLPEYDLLDPILKMYVEEDRSVPEMAAAGYPEDVVRRVVKLVDGSEYKRRQAPPGVKITPRALGKDRRMPITNRSNG